MLILTYARPGDEALNSRTFTPMRLACQSSLGQAVVFCRWR